MSVVADGKRKIRTRRIPPDETSDEASSPLLLRSSAWSVAGGEACVDAVSIGSCVDAMVVRWRMDYKSGGLTATRLESGPKLGARLPLSPGLLPLTVHLCVARSKSTMAFTVIAKLFSRKLPSLLLGKDSADVDSGREEG